MKVMFFSGWLSLRRTTAEIINRSAGGYFLQVRYRCLLGYMREKWVCADDIIELDEKFSEVKELERMMRP